MSPHAVAGRPSWTRVGMLWWAGVIVAALALGRQDGLAQEPVRVWVNLRSGVYHCPGTEFYGRTAQGDYLAEPVARSRGYRANGGRACGPLTGPDSSRVDSSGQAGGLRAGAALDAGPGAPAGPTLTCQLVRISDGDTIECAGTGRVRLIGVDAPESNQEPFGTAATAGLAALAPVGTTLQLEQDREARDQYGRLLAYAWLDGRMVNWLLVRQGWAVTLRFPPNVRWASAFDSAEALARAERRGLWQVGGFRCRPADRRRRAC